MFLLRFLVLPAALAALKTALAAPQFDDASNAGHKSNGNGQDANSDGGNQSDLALQSANVQQASNSNGDPNEQGQSNSLTNDANFINFCSGKDITNGLQKKSGSCNGIVMGDIPSQQNMISAIIINPQPGQNIEANKQFDVQVQIANLQAGKFTNPDDTYYAAPQQLQNGKVVGHAHVTIQDLGDSLTPSSPPDAATFAFFKGINDDGNGNGLLKATVTNGLPAGNYRVCTMNSAANHQPVLMPVAQRGAQDDCTKFTVGNKGGGSDGNNNSGSSSSSKDASSPTQTSVGRSSRSSTTSSSTSGAATSRQTGSIGSGDGNNDPDTKSSNTFRTVTHSSTSQSDQSRTTTTNSVASSTTSSNGQNNGDFNRGDRGDKAFN